MDGFHICDPPMEQRPASAPTEWQCPECGSWWEVAAGVPQEVAPDYDFLAHRAIVPARWVPSESH